MNDDTLVIIPALKKNAVIPDQLIKKINGITLIQRAIDTALKLTDSQNIFIITDSEEIALISQRNKIEFFLDSELKFDSSNILQIISNIIEKFQYKNILLYRANTPLIGSEILKKAYKEFLLDDDLVLTSVKSLDKELLKYNKETLKKVDKKYFKELKAFYIYKKENAFKVFKPYIIEHEKSIEINSYQDWWICEKVLQRKKIVFNVIGDTQKGMGHIYHSLALAHEITDHEIIFICDEKYKLAVEKVASTDYKVLYSSNTVSLIEKIKPDIVINDILNTSKKYIKNLKKLNMKVVNFEDLGDGSKYADMVFNELYDIPQKKGDHYLWGYEYLALRDEFNDASLHSIDEKVKSVLIAFGGTDQNNLTLVTLESILDIAKEYSIKINIVCGSGYLFKDELERYLKTCIYKNIDLTFASGVISQIMEKTQIAISSNGRTVYELAHMNIPSIVASHHKREATHSFATLEKGFINVGTFNPAIGDKIREKFIKLITDEDYRKLLFMNIQQYNFSKNKIKVVKKIMDLI